MTTNEENSNSSNVNVQVTCNQSTAQPGQKISFNIKYSAENGPGSIKPGEVLTFNLPAGFKNITVSYPKEHFSNVTVKGTTVTAIFGPGAKNAVAGDMIISCVPGEVNKKTSKTVTVNVGNETKSLTINVQPAPTTNVKYLKTFGDFVPESGYNSSEIITKPVVGKEVSYTMYVNGNYENLTGTVINDTFPPGIKLDQDSIQIYKVSKDGTEENVTSTFKNPGNITINPDSMKINMGNINSKYIIKYTGKVTESETEYVNTGSLTDSSGTIKSSATIGVENKNPIVIKSCASNDSIVDINGASQYVVSGIGSIVTYSLQINSNKESVTGMTIKDDFPEGMSYVPNTIEIGVYNTANNLEWVLASQFVTISDTGLTIDIGDTNKEYYAVYQLKVIRAEKSYANNLAINYNNTTANTSSVINYKKNDGAINAEKAVSTEVLTNGDSQIVTYYINFQSYGYFTENFIGVTENINNNVKILSVEVPSNFTYSINKETNTITFENSKGEISYGDNFSIKIITDFTNVPDGTTVSNTAKINQTVSNIVQTKKGYAFKATKVDDNDISILLSGAVFDLKDENNNIIAKLTSNSEGVITTSINSPGIYYLQEVTAPNGYFIDDEPIKFIITSSDVGQTINIGNVENNKGYEINIKKVDENNQSKLLEGAEFQIYNTDDTPNKLITIVTTNSEGIAKVILPEGEYKLVEIKAPIGYISSQPISFEIDEK